MYLDVIDLRDFYRSVVGRTVARLINAAAARSISPQPGLSVLGLGFATPYLSLFRDASERVIAFMPAPQGVMDWPFDGRSATALVKEDDFPLPDSCLDIVIIAHALELSPSPVVLMREVHRVLVSGGHLLAIVPNRRGLWAQSDISPLGHGRPFSRGQLRSLFADSGFECQKWDNALFLPPSGRRTIIRSANMLETIGNRAWPAFGGITIALATKSTLEIVKAPARARFVSALEPTLRPKPAGRVRALCERRPKDDEGQIPPVRPASS